MFGFFDSDIKRVRKLRIEYEDIRQRVLYKMNPYQQFSFISAYRGCGNEFSETLESIADDNLTRWRQCGDELKVMAQRGWSDSRRMSGLAGEGGMAGAEGFGLLAILCSAKGYHLAEALILKNDIQAFASEIEKLVDSRTSR